MLRLDEEIGESSTDEDARAQTSANDPVLIHCGFWRFNIDIHPLTRGIGWVLGRGRWHMKGDVTGGGVDILLTSDERESQLRGRHAGLVHNLSTSALLLVADKKVRLGDHHLGSSEVSVIGRRKAMIAFGDLEYEFAFTAMDQVLYRAQLQDLRYMLLYTGVTPSAFIDPTPAESDQELLGKYFIKKSFAQGSTCWLCVGIEKMTGRGVAVKKVVAISQLQVASVRNEVRAMQKLRQNSPPSVVKIIDTLFIEPSNLAGATECFIISVPLMESSLARVIGSVDQPSQLLILESMLEALDYIHKEGCMHRDIKPENVLVSLSPVQAVLTDFGSATWETVSNDHTKGTISYLAPEVIAIKENLAANDATYDNTADIWGMGLSIHELILGKRIKIAKITQLLYEKGLVTEIGTICMTNVWIGELIQNMLQWDPSRRWSAKQTYEFYLRNSQGLGKRELHGRKRDREA